MNLRKHVAGFVLFSAIVGCAVFINAYLTALTAAVPPVQDLGPAHQVSTAKTLPVSYSVGQVSLDLNEKRSYTGLRIQLLPGQPAPEALWVTTYLFSPAYPDKVWTTRTEIRKPFAQSNRVDVIATAMCGPCMLPDTFPARQNQFNEGDVCRDCGLVVDYKTGYFARVYLSTEYADNLYTTGEQFDRDIRTAVPVVINWPYDNSSLRPTLTIELEPKKGGSSNKVND